MKSALYDVSCCGVDECEICRSSFPYPPLHSFSLQSSLNSNRYEKEFGEFNPNNLAKLDCIHVSDLLYVLPLGVRQLLFSLAEPFFLFPLVDSPFFSFLLFFPLFERRISNGINLEQQNTTKKEKEQRENNQRWDKRNGIDSHL